MRNIVIITAKGSNSTLENKNLIDIAGRKSLEWQIKAARDASLTSEIYITTEDEKIKDVGKANDVQIIDRPSELSLPDTNHGDVIKHAVDKVAELNSDIFSITILLGNTVMVNPEDIDTNIRKLIENEEADSAMTVWEAQDDHPVRALKVNSSGYLESYHKINGISTNRQSYSKVYFYDQGPWTMKFERFYYNLNYKSGPGPWWWMGKNSIPVPRPWVTGKDTHNEFDLEIQKWFIENKRT